MNHKYRTAILALCLTGLCVTVTSAGLAFGLPEPGVAQLARIFEREVDMRLDVPVDEQSAYAQRLEDNIVQFGLGDLPAQYFAIVDRNPNIQALLIYWRSVPHDWTFIGASPVSTGKPDAFDHFRTPLGVFEHSLDNLDFRAEGTKNEFGIRGYGRKGMRVFDFGWTPAERGWGSGGQSAMRLQMHATDPDVLEGQLGLARSKGCIRIPATLTAFLDRYGVLDANYESAVARGQRLWVLRADRISSPQAGRYLVIVESDHGKRPAWAPLPADRAKRRIARHASP